jgi:hypothetical protein
MTVAELNVRMSAREFSQWMDYFRSEPFGPVRDNLHAGQITATFYNANRGKGRPALSASDFLLMSSEGRMERNSRRAVSVFKALAKPKVN